MFLNNRLKTRRQTKHPPRRLYYKCTVTNAGILPPRSLLEKKWRTDVPDPMRSGSSSPVSILARMLLEHLRKASSTHSPVLALASRNISPFSWANLKIRHQHMVREIQGIYIRVVDPHCFQCRSASSFLSHNGDPDLDPRETKQCGSMQTSK